MEEKYDLAIVGGGPVGLFTGYFAALHGLRPIILESLANPGGQPQMLYPAKDMLDIPVFAHIKGTDLTRHLLACCESQQVKLVTDCPIKTLAQTTEGYLLNDRFSAKSVIIATGTGAFKPKKPALRLDEETASHLHYALPDPNFFKGKKVAVLGGGDSAFDFALQLAPVASSVTIIHRRTAFRAMETSVQKVGATDNIQLSTPYLPKAAQMKDGQLQLFLKQVGGDHNIEESFDEALVAYGFLANNRFLRKWGIELNEGLVKVDRQMQTNLPGVYAVGDSCTYTGRVPVIGLGFGEAQIAILQVMRRLLPEKKLTIHSTAIGQDKN
jgi:thioredoxin reductase